MDREELNRLVREPVERLVSSMVNHQLPAVQIGTTIREILDAVLPAYDAMRDERDAYESENRQLRVERNWAVAELSDERRAAFFGVLRRVGKEGGS